MLTIAGIFGSRADAERAAARLRSIGVAEEHLALLSPARLSVRSRKRC